MNIKKWLKENTTSLNNKTVAITGATGSLGFYIAHYLLLKGANLILVGRNKNKLEELIDKYQININLNINDKDLYDNVIKKILELE